MCMHACLCTHGHFSPEFFYGVMEGYVLGRVNNYIKAVNLHIPEDQRESLTVGP